MKKLVAGLVPAAALLLAGCSGQEFSYGSQPLQEVAGAVAQWDADFAGWAAASQVSTGEGSGCFLAADEAGEVLAEVLCGPGWQLGEDSASWYAGEAEVVWGGEQGEIPALTGAISGYRAAERPQGRALARPDGRQPGDLAGVPQPQPPVAEPGQQLDLALDPAARPVEVLFPRSNYQLVAVLAQRAGQGRQQARAPEGHTLAQVGLAGGGFGGRNHQDAATFELVAGSDRHRLSLADDAAITVAVPDTDGIRLDITEDGATQSIDLRSGRLAPGLAEGLYSGAEMVDTEQAVVPQTVTLRGESDEMLFYLAGARRSPYLVDRIDEQTITWAGPGQVYLTIAPAEKGLALPPVNTVELGVDDMALLIDGTSYPVVGRPEREQLLGAAADRTGLFVIPAAATSAQVNMTATMLYDRRASSAPIPVPGIALDLTREKAGPR